MHQKKTWAFCHGTPGCWNPSSELLLNFLVQSSAKNSPNDLQIKPDKIDFTGCVFLATPLKNMTSSIGMIIETPLIHGKIKFMATSYHQPVKAISCVGWRPYDHPFSEALCGPSTPQLHQSLKHRDLADQLESNPPFTVQSTQQKSRSTKTTMKSTVKKKPKKEWSYS